MITARAFRVVHNLDVPDRKKKFWPQWSTVVVNRSGSIEDVIQHFDAPSLAMNAEHMRLYPHSVQFTVQAGEMFVTLAEFERRVEDAAGVWELETNMKNAQL